MELQSDTISTQVYRKLHGYEYPKLGISAPYHFLEDERTLGMRRNTYANLPVAPIQNSSRVQRSTLTASYSTRPYEVTEALF